MRAIYDQKVWEAFYRMQAIQSGHGLPGFSGMTYQRGLGIGSFFRNLIRMIIPAARSVAKSAGKAVAKEALITGSNVASDLIQGQSFGESVKKRGKTAASNLLNRAKDKLIERQGYTNLAYQSGDGLGTLVNNKRKRPTKSIKRKQPQHKASNVKRARRMPDQLGYNIGLQYA